MSFFCYSLIEIFRYLETENGNWLGLIFGIKWKPGNKMSNNLKCLMARYSIYLLLNCFDCFKCQHWEIDYLFFVHKFEPTASSFKFNDSFIFVLKMSKLLYLKVLSSIYKHYRREQPRRLDRQQTVSYNCKRLKPTMSTPCEVSIYKISW